MQIFYFVELFLIFSRYCVKPLTETAKKMMGPGDITGPRWIC